MAADLPRLHPSSLVQWQSCGRQFEIETMRRVPPAWRHPSALNGTAIHRVIDLVHSRNLWNVDRAAIAAVYRECFSWAVLNPVREEEANVPVFWGEHRDEETAFPRLAADGLDMINGYRHDPRNREAKILVSEGKWRATFGGFDWEGTIDQARDLGDGTVQLVDLKSGQERMNATSLALWPQGFTYVLALAHAVFRPIAADQFAPWTPLKLNVSRLSWLHLRDYIPYLKASRRGSVEYKRGDLRGPAFYDVEVTKQALSSHVREIGMFAQAVASGRFERRPSTYQCSRCKVAATCLKDFYGSLDEATIKSLRITEEDYGTEANGG